ncbi:CPBP family intramembrane metalloprotease [Marinobacter confluentis]|uniref:CPBP family intramembrane metalloprotease n=1 Tax=Marinobacter confluentis TaxID=1697557 RepID=A0A4Z1CCV4_9GAMM|nr:CPBP family intramembrane metalloprotease [Marinobacter confluentis]
MSPQAALLFQGAIGAVGLIAIVLFSIPVPAAGISPGAAFGLGLAGAILTYGIILLLCRLFGDSAWHHQMEKLHQFACDYSWHVLIALSVFAGVGEELLFRGAIQGWIAQQFHPLIAIAVASVLFGLVHFLSFAYFVMATGLGLVLGAVYALTDSLFLVMVWHGVYDMIALYSLRRHPHLFGVK